MQTIIIGVRMGGCQKERNEGRNNVISQWIIFSILTLEPRYSQRQGYITSMMAVRLFSKTMSSASYVISKMAGISFTEQSCNWEVT